MAANKKYELKLTRVYDAPVKAVWDAWTDPKQVVKWWGPRGFTITHHDADLRPGGFWKYTMFGPDGAKWENQTTYLEVEPLKRLVYDHGGGDDRPPLFQVTVTFQELKGKTKMEMTMGFATLEALEHSKKVIKNASGNSTWDRLGEHLAQELEGKERFIINRTFDAPLKTMFRVWTDPSHFSTWLPPAGATMEFLRADIRPGGSAFYVMPGPHGKMYGRAEYLEIREPDRIVYTQQFCDQNEKIARHPMSPTWPQTMLTTVILAEEEPGRTRVTIQWEPHGKATREEIETFVKARGGMTQGWTGSFDKLEAYLAEQR